MYEEALSTFARSVVFCGAKRLKSVLAPLDRVLQWSHPDILRTPSFHHSLFPHFIVLLFVVIVGVVLLSDVV